MFNHYICTRSLLPSDRDVQGRKQKEKERREKVRENHTGITGGNVPLTVNMKSRATESRKKPVREYILQCFW